MRMSRSTLAKQFWQASKKTHTTTLAELDAKLDAGLSAPDPRQGRHGVSAAAG
jgi:hypothetical protein